MINIELFSIDFNSNSIKVKASSQAGSTIDRAVLYHNNNIINKEGIDISSLFSKESNVEFSIPISILTDMSGVWFITITNSFGHTATKYVVDFSKYYECVLGKLLSLEINGCDIISKNECSDCKDLTLYIATLIDMMEKSLLYKYYEEAFLIMKQLEELCDGCGTTHTNTAKCNCS